MMHTHLLDEFELLLRIGALSQPELAAANERGHDASFIGRRAVAARRATTGAYRPTNTPFDEWSFTAPAGTVVCHAGTS
jgi:hypothetical protein